MTGSRRKPAASPEAAALRAAAGALLENRAFAGAARAVLEECKRSLGADAGLVAVCAVDGQGLEVAVLDPGSLELGSAAGLPAPLRRLSARAVKAGRTVFANNLSKCTAKRPPPGRRAVPESALLAPILIAGEVATSRATPARPGST
jgi:GAF domain-containing protein